jgi:hypothetical protein
MPPIITTKNNDKVKRVYIVLYATTFLKHQMIAELNPLL